ncbi:MAG: DUF4163 domain-containing protein [Bacteroidales bacterium]
MKNKIGILGLVIVLSFAFISCERSAIPEFEKTEFNKTVNDCDSGSCVDIHLAYFLMKEEFPAAKVFNPIMENMVFSKMSYLDEEKTKSKEEIVERVINDYKAFKLEFPDAVTGGYMQTTESTITYQSNHLVSFLLESDVYSGGAHGSHMKEFLNINPQTGKKIVIEDMITRKSEFNKLVENKLRAKLGMGSQDNWADFTFLDQFILPANMGLTTEGLLLIYNEYEILSFADGITEIFLTMEELNPFLDLGK